MAGVQQHPRPYSQEASMNSDNTRAKKPTDSSSTDSQPDIHARIPACLTTSFRAITDAFGENIVAISAHGGTDTTNATPVEDLREYFLTRKQTTHHGLTIDYTQEPGEDGPHNPLTHDARQRILDQVDTVLPTDDLPVDPDLTVTSCTLRVTDERLQAVTPARTPEFDLHFVANPAEDSVRDRTKRLNADRGLYAHLGFDIRNLNLHAVVETTTKFHHQADGRYYSWQGPHDLRPRAPAPLVTRINNHILPDDFGTLKIYTISANEELELAGTTGGTDPTHPFGDTADASPPSPDTDTHPEDST